MCYNVKPFLIGYTVFRKPHSFHMTHTAVCVSYLFYQLVSLQYVYQFRCLKVQAKLELVKVDGEVDHAKAFGRIAFSCDRSEVRVY